MHLYPLLADFFMAEKIFNILAIGGSDCMGGAGIQADIRAINSCGMHALTAVTAVTSQNSKGLKISDPVKTSLLKSQIESILEEVTPDAVKIGMIGSYENGVLMHELLKHLDNEIPIVVDPVVKASAGGNLNSRENETEKIKTLYLEKLFPISKCVTPNLKEAAFFLNDQNISPKYEIFSKIKKIIRSESVILKGGHIHTNDNLLTDYLIYNESNELEILEVKHKKVACSNLHGTGCTYASILASLLARGENIKMAFQLTSEKIHEIICKSDDYIMGNSSYGPLNVTNYIFK